MGTCVLIKRSWYYTPKNDGKTEPLGARIIEMPDDEENFINRDSRVTFTAYVAKGSIEHGKALVNGADQDRIPACTACHGASFGGMDSIPPLAGRSPSMIVRQLYDFKTGNRHGSMAAVMHDNSAHMETADMIAIAAYLANLPPP